MKKKKKQAKEERVGEKESVLDIDLLNLEKDWVHHPRLMEKYSNKVANARLDQKVFKSSLEVYSAELYIKIRKKATEQDAKPSETTIKSLIAMDKGMKSRNSQLFELEHRVDILQGMVASIVDRRRALEKLVDLHGQQYFSAPRSPQNDREYGAEATKKAARKSYDI